MSTLNQLILRVPLPPRGEPCWYRLYRTLYSRCQNHFTQCRIQSAQSTSCREWSRMSQGIRRWTHQQRFIVPKDTHSKYGLVVYSKHIPGTNIADMVAGTRYLLIMLLVTTPICIVAGYVDLVLRHGANCDLQPLISATKIPVAIISVILLFGYTRSRTWLSRLYYDKSIQKIHVETYNGLCKSKVYGPYNPSIGVRRVSTKKVKNKFITEEHLVFNPDPWTTSFSTADIKTYMTPENFLGSSKNEGADMGNREFLISTSLDPKINSYLKEEKLYKKLFKIHEAENEAKSKKSVYKGFDD